MYQKATRLLLLFLLLVSTQAAVAQTKPAYQYMQLFYYGGKTMSGPIGHFSPAMRGQTDIMLTAPTAYMQRMAQMMGGSGSGMTQQVSTTSSADIIDLTKMTLAQRRKYEEKEQEEQRQQNQELIENTKKFVRMSSEHAKALTDQITQSLNLAAEDGWEVAQMSSFGTDGVVYLLRKAR
ncbi:hypothetical protein [Hymenobacter actinosclerus]|uniref:DUF4142 domain-containing protein n=1 Tax=Hymenobacter actinosclerus TaxID=82805 RepID=A0A1H9ZRF1_9BACT|nr:hypothetical protein [Hymenobacter actinosclerus]SES83937.1 hypothetical protein SAMN04487998_0431 [Hymenobacter actinosclerus]